MAPAEPFRYGRSDVVICHDEHDLGRRAAAAVAATMRRLLAGQDSLRLTVAAGESQITFLDALAREPGIDWARVTCFSIDDFYHRGIPDRYTCGYQVQTQLWNKVKPGQCHRMRADADDPAREAARFEQILRGAGRLDILCQGIGTSGHLALNEPLDTDFADPAWIRVVNIAAQSKRQLIADPNFKALGFIPDRGITMTIPAILSARHLFTMVPLALKRPILTRLFATPAPTAELPASILHQAAGTIFVDRNSCPESWQRSPGPAQPSQT